MHRRCQALRFRYKRIRIRTDFATRKFTVRVAYRLASSGLCVTITTRRSVATSFKSSMTCTLVSESSAPVGSSAKEYPDCSQAPARSRHAASCPAGHLARLLVQLRAKADLFQRLCRPTSPLAAGNTGNRHRQLHICEHGLVRDQVIALETQSRSYGSGRNPSPGPYTFSSKYH